MVQHSSGRKNNLGMFIGLKGIDSPEVITLRKWSTIVNLHLLDKISFSREEGKANLPSHTIPIFDFPNKDGTAAIRILADAVLDRFTGRVIMSMGEVKFKSP